MRNKRDAVGRGIRHKCPACGLAPFYKSYLKPVDHCEICGTDLSNFNADDGPAWLTILMLSPVTITIGVLIFLKSPLPYAANLIGVSLFLIGAVLLLLPRVKAGFIAFIWAVN